jgi:selenocysteine lyase/cysteine desulfurase
MNAIRAYEQMLSVEMLRMLSDIGADVYGVREPRQADLRVPTFCFNIPGVAPQAVTDAAVRAGLGIRDGHLYAPRLMRRLGLSLETGAVRVSLVHYNTKSDVQRLGNVLRDVARKRA